MAPRWPLSAEWLEADGLGGFASGTVGGKRTRRYHALLLVATTPPTGRLVLVNGFDAWVDTPAGNFAISSQHYAPKVTHPDGETRLDSFDIDPWPRWTYRLDDGLKIEQELFVPHETAAVALRWRLLGQRVPAMLIVRPFLSGRDYHATHHENQAFQFEADIGNGRVFWRPYGGHPGVVALSNGEYAHQPAWYRNFLYTEERERGLDHTEDLASPGIFRWDLLRSDAIWLLTAQEPPASSRRLAVDLPAEAVFPQLREQELRRRQAFPSALERAADAYLVRRGTGKTIIAGYPWFTAWGRDTFIALRGLCLATGRLDEARDILLDWSGMVSQGMVPNRFPDRGQEPEFNAVDASLWYVIAVHDYWQAATAAGREVPGETRERLRQAVEAILAGYIKGTRYGIRMDEDGLLRAGQPGVQLTWMDAKVGDWVVTPRIGKPVEVQALWLNALWVGSPWSNSWLELFQRGSQSFRLRFWNEAGGCLYDVVDVDHRPGAVDASFRPNQIFALGGLPVALLHGEQARKIVDAIEARLVTPMGLRTLAPGTPAYRPRYQGGARERDGAYHQGTVWPWLLGPFAEAWVRVGGGGSEVKREARTRFLEPLRRHVEEAGLDHLSEIADADSPHTPRGCPFQAWSLGEFLRLERVVLAGAATVRGRQA